MFVYMCSVAEFRAPFVDPTSPVIKAGLRLLSIAEYTTPLTKYGMYAEYVTCIAMVSMGNILLALKHCI